MRYIRFSELPTTDVADVGPDDYTAVLDTSENVLKKTSVGHASERASFGLSTDTMYGHSKTVDSLTHSELIPGESLSAREGFNIARNIGTTVEKTTTAQYAHAEGTYFMLMDQFVYCTANIEVGDQISAHNFRPVTVGEVFTEFKETFQAGVDAVYNACIAAGLTPASSTPEDIAAAITSVAGGDATPEDLLENKKAFSDGSLIEGTMPNKGAWTGATTGSGNVTVPKGYHNGSGYVSGQGAYNKGVTDADARANPDSANWRAGRAQGQADLAPGSVSLTVIDQNSAIVYLHNSSGLIMSQFRTDQTEGAWNVWMGYDKVVGR